MKLSNLIEGAEKEVNEALNDLKDRIRKEVDEVISSIKCCEMNYIESDAWINYRNDMKQELAYDNGILKDDYGWARNVRLRILQENRGELIAFLNKDLIERVKELEDKLQEYSRYRYTL